MRTIQESFQELKYFDKVNFFPNIKKKTTVEKQNEIVQKYLEESCNTEKKRDKINTDVEITPGECSKKHFTLVNTNHPNIQCTDMFVICG